MKSSVWLLTIVSYHLFLFRAFASCEGKQWLWQKRGNEIVLDQINVHESADDIDLGRLPAEVKIHLGAKHEDQIQRKPKKVTINTIFEEQSKKPQELSSFPQTRSENAKCEKSNLSAARSVAMGFEKMYHSSKDTSKTIQDQSIGACQQLIKVGENTVIAENDNVLVRRATSGSHDSSQESRKAKERKKSKRPANDLVDRSSQREPVKRRRNYTGIRIGRETEKEIVQPSQQQQQQPKQKSSSGRRHSVIHQNTNELRRKMYRLRFSTNQRRERLLRTFRRTKNRQAQSKQNSSFRPIRPVRQASSPQTVRSQVAYQSDSSVSSALSNRQYSKDSRQSRPIDHQQIREASDKSASSSSASKISSMSPDS